jgi:hypothetical protein
MEKAASPDRAMSRVMPRERYLRVQVGRVDQRARRSMKVAGRAAYFVY